MTYKECETGVAESGLGKTICTALASSLLTVAIKMLAY